MFDITKSEVASAYDDNESNSVNKIMVPINKDMFEKCIKH